MTKTTNNINFKSKEISVTDISIQFKRNRFVYKEVYFNDIDSINVFNGYLINNVWIARLLGISLFLISMYLIKIGIDEYNSYSEMTMLGILNKGALITFWGPIAISFFGLILIIASFIESRILEVIHQNQKAAIRLRSFDKNKNADSLIKYLNEKIKK